MAMATTTTPSKPDLVVADNKNKAFGDALYESCIRHRVLAYPIDQLLREHPGITQLPPRSHVLLEDKYVSAAGKAAAAVVPPQEEQEASSSFTKYVTAPVNYVWNSTPVKMAGKALAFVVNGELGKMAVPKSDYDSDDEDDDDNQDEKETDDTANNNKEDVERLLDSDVVVNKSLLATTTTTLKHALELIDPTILSASELRGTLLAKLEEMKLMDRERRLWLKDLPSVHWGWLIREMGLEAVPTSMLVAAGAAAVGPPLYILGSSDEYTTETRITLYSIDKNIVSTSQKIATYETKMQLELATAKRATVRQTKMYHFKLSKLFEKKAEQAQTMLLNLQEVRASVDHAVLNVGTVAALQSASATLKAMRLDGEKIHDVLDDLQEHVNDVALDAEYFHEISPQYDEEDIMAELNALSVLEDQPVAQPAAAPSREGTVQLPDISEAELRQLKVDLENLLVDEAPTAVATAPEAN